MTIEVVTTINEALCERHRRMCSPSHELLRECGRVDDTRMAFEREFEYLDNTICHDVDPAFCTTNKTQADCKDKWVHMAGKCARFRGLCPDLAPKRIGLGSTTVVDPSHGNNVAFTTNALCVVALAMLAIALMVRFAPLWRGRWQRCRLCKREKSVL